MRRKRLAIIGAGMRAQRFLRALAEDHKDDCEVVAICDSSMDMLKVKSAELSKMGLAPRSFHSDDFDEMIAQTQPDEVIVLTPDYAHEQYACRAMVLGCDVIIEKPLTTSIESCMRFLQTQHETGRSCKMALNYRYAPFHCHIKRLLMDGAIGGVRQVNWITGVRLSHGAKFFHRWHSNKENTVSLLSHKAIHNFDLLHFWLADVPKRVFATSSRKMFGPENATRYGMEAHGERCGECTLTNTCPFFWDTVNLPSANETPEVVRARGRESGYYRDLCVFREDITADDTFSIAARYEGGAQLTMTWEVARTNSYLEFAGTRGALVVIDSGISIKGQDGSVEIIEPWTGQGGHGGGDTLMWNSMFSKTPQEDPYGCRADLRDGVWSMLMAISATESADTGRPVDITDKLSLERPDFVSIPSITDPIPTDALRKKVQYLLNKQPLADAPRTEAESYDAEG